eukprot:jgi/Botrbrau1/4758/Bobra.0137s0030.1
MMASAVPFSCSFTPSWSAARRCRQRTEISSRRQCFKPQALFNKGGDGAGGNPLGALGNMANLMENMKKAQAMVQREATKLQEELARAEFEGYSEDETVKVIFSGNQEPKSIDLTEEALEGGLEALTERITQAMKESHGKSVEGMKEKMKSLAAGLGVPNLPQGFGN